LPVTKAAQRRIQSRMSPPSFNPVQAYKLRAELDKLASFGRPIWIMEMDSAEVDEQKKADMLEFAYREYFARPWRASSCGPSGRGPPPPAK
jgi:hypothetical protein